VAGERKNTQQRRERAAETERASATAHELFVATVMVSRCTMAMLNLDPTAAIQQTNSAKQILMIGGSLNPVSFITVVTCYSTVTVTCCHWLISHIKSLNSSTVYAELTTVY
jgi:hypothetical protein